MRKMKVIVGGIIEKDGKYLLVQEAKKNVIKNGIFQQDIQTIMRAYNKEQLEKSKKKLGVMLNQMEFAVLLIEFQKMICF